MSLKIKRTNEEILEWFEILERWRESGMGRVEFCKENNIPLGAFANMKRNLYLCQYEKPDHYKTLIDLAEKYLSSKKTSRQFSEENNIDQVSLGNAATHLKYLRLLEKAFKEKYQQESSMNFVQIDNSSKDFDKKDYSEDVHNEIQEEVREEVIEKRNDVELMIAKGIKVFISPNIEAEKIIKIIELLKDI